MHFVVFDVSQGTNTGTSIHSGQGSLVGGPILTLSLTNRNPKQLNPKNPRARKSSTRFLPGASKGPGSFGCWKCGSDFAVRSPWPP